MNGTTKGFMVGLVVGIVAYHLISNKQLAGKQ